MYLQSRRLKKALRYIPQDSVVLDIGCHKGELFVKLGSKLRYGVGIDPSLPKEIILENYELRKDIFPSTHAENKLYHAITMLAVFEHIPRDHQENVVEACYKLLHTDGVMILTVPNKKVDRILSVLQKLRFVKGMNSDEHYGFDHRLVPSLFANGGFRLIKHQRFQLSLNNLFVFKKALP